MRKKGDIVISKQQSIGYYQPHTKGGNTMERCEDCTSHLRQIGHDIYYCDECDKIITIPDEIMVK